MSTRPATRPVLRAGLRVLQRERDVVQVGLDPSRAVRLVATPAVRRTLAALTRGGSPGEHDPEVVARLAALGLLAQEQDAVVEQPGSVLVRRFGQALPAPLASALAEVGLAVPPDGSSPAGARERPRVVLLVGIGEPRRELLDELVAADQAHLLLRFSEGDATVGPFVVPGVTACLRCVDAHHADRDPRWPLLVEQQARLTAHRRGDGVADPVDPLLARLAAAWAARDLACSEGWPTSSLRPATWSTTIRLPPELAGFEAVSWLRHPDCGCGVGAPTPTVMARR